MNPGFHCNVLVPDEHSLFWDQLLSREADQCPMEADPTVTISPPHYPLWSRKRRYLENIRRDNHILTKIRYCLRSSYLTFKSPLFHSEKTKVLEWLMMP